MEITGHSRESTFLSYIGENPNKDAVADVFMKRLRRLGNGGKGVQNLKITYNFYNLMTVLWQFKDFQKIND